MCGILGGININKIEDYLDYIKHRGPDAFGMKAFRTGNNKINLLHRRLSILDLSESGKQPMFSHNSKACIIFNGEIYNHLDLKGKLRDTDFNGHSDTETIVNYFHEFGISKSLKDLNGIFAFAYFDSEKELLYLARDRFGVKPLYYWFKNNELLFASEIRPLEAYLKSDINKGALMNSLQMRYSPSPSTIYCGIKKVEPGQLLIFDCRTDILLRKEYFISTPNSLGTKKDEYKKLVKEYGDLFVKAVERQLMSDVEVGILLSGGLDSALIAAIAKEKSKSKLKTFTVGFDGDYKVNEIDYANETAKILGLDNYSEKIDFSHFLSSIRKIVKIVEEPIGTTSIIPMFYLSKLASSKVKVVLSGQGADEPLGGYNKYKGLPFLEKSQLVKQFVPLTKTGQFIYNRNEYLRRLITSMQSSNDTASLIAFNAISSTKEVANLITRDKRKLYLNKMQDYQMSFKQIWEKRMPQKSTLTDLFLYYDIRTSLADNLLMYTDKITMNFSLECRVPILDNDLINFLEDLHNSYKFNRRTGKIIHKTFAQEYLPSTIIDRKKLCFKSPTEIWFKENYNRIKILLSSSNRFNSIFDLTAVNNLLLQHKKGKNLEKQIFLLLSLYYVIEDCKN